MKMKPSKGLILSAVGAGLLLLQTAGLSINAPYIGKVAEAVCALLVVLGIITTTASGKDNPLDDSADDDSVKNDSADESKNESDCSESVDTNGDNTACDNDCPHYGDCKTKLACDGCRGDDD